jgi:hypothetical protein
LKAFLIAALLHLPAEPVFAVPDAPVYVMSDSSALRRSRGSISGKVTGMARSTASLFHVSLYEQGPGSRRRLVQSQPLNHQRGYRFENLPDGEYWLYVGTQAPTLIEAYPATVRVRIKKGQTLSQDVELR